MCTYWQNTVYLLSVVKRNAQCEVGKLYPVQVYLIYRMFPKYYLLHFTAWYFSFFLSNRRQGLYAALISPLQQYTRYIVSC